MLLVAPAALPAQQAVPITETGAGRPAVPTERDTTADARGRIAWRAVGPANQAGRISAVAGVPGNRDVYYVAGANGGIIKTTNGGTTFKPIFDKQSATSIGAIAVAPSDPNVIYVGTGEGNPRKKKWHSSRRAFCRVYRIGTAKAIRQKVAQRDVFLPDEAALRQFPIDQ